MADKTNKLKARLPRGFADRGPAEIAATRRMLATIREVFERYGFEPLENPAIEYTDALGKFLPDQDRPNEGVFSFQDDDEQWLSLRYDLTAPLARYVAENFDTLPKPHRSYREGFVFRDEKPGPGRYRQFMQFDADTVGSASMAADAEMCMLAADTMEALGIKRGDYVVKVNSRKVLDGVMDAANIPPDKRLLVLRAMDKYDRLGMRGVMALLGSGRKDESGDFTKGADLTSEEIDLVVQFVSSGGGDKSELKKRLEAALQASALGPDKVRLLLKQGNTDNLALSEAQKSMLLPFLTMFPGFSQPGSSPRRERWKDDLSLKLRFEDDEFDLPIDNFATIRKLHALSSGNPIFDAGVTELEHIAMLTEASRYGSGRILIDPSVVRGLEYYTGPVYEVDLTFEIKDEQGRPVRFGSVGGGGRYDGLVARFRGEQVPATGFSIGVSRLQAALTHLGKLDAKSEAGPVVVTVLDQDRIADYQRMVSKLREAGIRAELYLGAGKMGPQMKYADKRGAPCVVIQGGDEKARGEVQIKDLIAGAEAAAAIASNQEWREARPAQFAVKEEKLVEAVREVLARHGLR